MVELFLTSFTFLIKTQKKKNSKSSSSNSLNCVYWPTKQPNGLLNSKLILECTQRRSGVVGPVAPGASGQAILQSRTRTAF